MSPEREGPVLHHGDVESGLSGERSTRLWQESPGTESSWDQTFKGLMRCPTSLGDGPANTTKVEPGSLVVRRARGGSGGGGVTICPHPERRPRGSPPTDSQVWDARRLPSCPVAVPCLSNR